MRHLVTFILRLWVNTEAVPPACEGEVECVATGERIHVRKQEDVARFVKTRLDLPCEETTRQAENAPPQDQIVA